MNACRFALNLVLFLFLGNAYAAVDPVSWSLNPASGFPAAIPGQSSSVTYTLTVNPKFPGPVTLHTQFIKSYHDFTITDGCNNQTLNKGASCTVVIAFVPTDTTMATIQMSYQYNDNVIPLPTLSVSGTAQNSGIVGTISGLPSTISLSNPEQQPIFTVTYKNTSSAAITGYAGNSSGLNLLATSSTSVATVAVVSDSNTCGTVNAPVIIKGGHSCTIQGQVTPVSAGSVTISGLFTYNNGSDTANPSQPTKVVSDSGTCFSAEATLPFQNPTLRYADNILHVTYSNGCATAQTLGEVTFGSTGTSSSPTILGNPYNAAYDDCSSQSIAAHGHCTVLVSVIPQNDGTLTVTATASSVSASSTTTVNEPSYNHSITMVNQCPFPVWYGVGAPGDPTSSPSPSAYMLDAQVSTEAPTTKTITVTASGDAYSGIIIPRTGCTLNSSSFTCATGDCVSGTNGQCTNTGFEPFTRIEEVFPTSSTQGNYDITLQMGATVPVEYKGLGPSTNDYTLGAAAAFVCSGAGAPIPIPFEDPPYSADITLGACSWTYTVPNTPAGSSPVYYFVTNDSGALSSCSSCNSPSVCGLAYETTPEDGTIVLACGELLGYWSLNQLGNSPASDFTTVPSAYNPYTLFEFTKDLTVANGFQSGYPTGANAYDLYSCTPQDPALQTCYPSTDGSLCCGAQNWNAAGSYGSYLTAQDSDYAGGAPNPDWTETTALPITPYASILWLKLACPTAYSYPFDDPSSSFNCDNSDAAMTQAVAMDFEIVFCPGGIY